MSNYSDPYVRVVLQKVLLAIVERGSVFGAASLSIMDPHNYMDSRDGSWCTKAFVLCLGFFPSVLNS